MMTRAPISIARRTAAVSVVKDGVSLPAVVGRVRVPPRLSRGLASPDVPRPDNHRHLRPGVCDCPHLVRDPADLGPRDAELRASGERAAAHFEKDARAPQTA